MAVGSFLGGRLADRVRSPLLAYAVLEGSIAIVVLLTPALFIGLDAVYRSFYQGAELDATLLGVLKLLLSVIALAPATVLMGATLPALTRYLSTTHVETGHQFGRLYAANTIGGILGSALSGYVLIELLGLSVTLVLGACLSGSAALAALLLRRQVLPRRLHAVVPLTAPSAQTAPRTLVLLTAFISGCTSLGYQVLWTRLLSSGTDNSTYVFTTILVLFLTGIAVGARLHGMGLGRHLDRLDLLGGSQVLVAFLSIAGAWIIGSLGFGGARLIVVLVATIVMGFALPVAAGLVSRDDRRIGSDAGLLLAVNMIGVIVGTSLVPFVLIPLVGTMHGVLLLGAVNALFGALLLASLRPRTVRRFAMGAASGLVLVAVIGPFVVPQMIRYPHAVEVAKAGELFDAAEDEIAAVEAGSIDGKQRLWVAGVSMTQLTVDAKLMALLPLMTRPSAERMLIVAFGMGSSFRSALRAGLRTDAVELVPSVPRMFHYYYSDASEVLSDPRGRLIIADGRNYVELADERYDIVVVDPPPPVRSSGTGVLYSRQFYQAAASRLNDGGVMMEWMPYGQKLDEFRAQVHTFLSVFPHSMYVLSPVDLGVFMLGSRQPFGLKSDAVASVLNRAGVMADIASSPDAPGSSVTFWQRTLPQLVLMTDRVAHEFADEAPVITDDRPFTEYFLLRDMFGSPSPELTRETVVKAVNAMPDR